MAILFTSDWETGNLTEWTGNASSADCSIIGNNTVYQHHGAYNMKATLGANKGAGLFANVYYGSLANAYRTLHVRAMNCLVSVLPEDAGDFYRFFSFANSTGATIITAYGIINSGGTNYWYMRKRTGGAFSDVISAVSPVANKCYTIECQIIQSTAGNSDGAQRMWVDGVLVAEATNLDNDDRTLDYLAVGHVSSTAPDVQATSFYCDCLVLATSAINAEMADTASLPYTMTQLINSKVLYG